MSSILRAHKEEMGVCSGYIFGFAWQLWKLLAKFTLMLGACTYRHCSSKRQLLRCYPELSVLTTTKPTRFTPQKFMGEEPTPVVTRAQFRTYKMPNKTT